MAPIFTGNWFGFGAAAGAAPPRGHVEVLFSEYNTLYGSSTSQVSSPTKVLNPSIKYLYVIGAGAGGAGTNTVGPDNGGGAGGGAGSIPKLTGYSIPAPNYGAPIFVAVARGADTDAGASTQIYLNGAAVLTLGGGGGGVSNGGPGGAGGTVSVPGLSLLAAFPSSNEVSGGSGGQGGTRNVRAGAPGNSGTGGGGCGGGGGGGAHVSPQPGGSGGPSNHPFNINNYNIIQTAPALSYPNPFPISTNGAAGGPQAPQNGGGIVASGGDVGLALGGSGNGQDSNSGYSGGAGAGLLITSPNSPGTYFGGGGGGVRGQILNPNARPTIRGNGGGGFIIVVGSSFQLVAGVDY